MIYTSHCALLIALSTCSPYTWVSRVSDGAWLYGLYGLLLFRRANLPWPPNQAGKIAFPITAATTGDRECLYPFWVGGSKIIQIHDLCSVTISVYPPAKLSKLLAYVSC